MPPSVTSPQPILLHPEKTQTLRESPLQPIPESPAEYLQAYPTAPEPDRNQPPEALMAAAVLRRTADRITEEKTWIQGTGVRDITPRWQVLLASSLPRPLRRLLPDRRTGRCSVAGIFANACDSGIVPANITPGVITLVALDAMRDYLRKHGLNPDGDLIGYNDAKGRTLREVTDAMHGAARELEAQASYHRNLRPAV